MKKIALFLITAALLTTLASCGGKDDKAPSDTGATNNSETQGTTENKADAPKDSLELVNKVWDNYAEDDKFAVSGGSGDDMNMKGAGKFDISDAAAIDSALGFPAAEAGKIDDAASMLHMMNANTFTCGVYRVKDGEDVTALAGAIKDNIMKRQWMCGFPDKLVVASESGYIVSFFGEKEIVDNFKKTLTETYPSAEIVSDEAIA